MVKTAKSRNESEKFEAAMSAILKANPSEVKTAMEADRKERAKKRKARKLPSASDRASNGKN